jgi:hypothetical protein
MAFVAQAVGRRVLCYATANLLREEADKMVPRFADYWKKQTGYYPARLLFDSRATTYAGLSQLTQRRIGFITIRRRGSGMLARVDRLPAESWQHCQITQAKGKRRQVQYVDESVQLDDYEGSMRQLIVTGLGHESPTFFLTNDLPEPQTAREVIQTYASRNHVENHLGEQITFFHLDCLCSDVRLNVEFDLTLTVLADLLYRRLAERLNADFRGAVTCLNDTQLAWSLRPGGRRADPVSLGDWQGEWVMGTQPAPSGQQARAPALSVLSVRPPSAEGSGPVCSDRRQPPCP